MEVEEKREGGHGENWWGGWDRRQQMAVAQVICYVAYAIRAFYVRNYDRECSESVESRKWKVREWERQFEGIREAINDVAEAIREGNAIIEKTLECVYSRGTSV